MRTFDQLYGETSTSATFTLGYESKDGKLIITSHKTEQGRASTWGSFSYDGKTALLRVGDVQMGLPGKLIIGTMGGDEQSVLLDGSDSTLTLGDRNAGNGTVRLKNRFGTEVVTVSGENAILTLGRKTTVTNERADGKVFVLNSAGATTVVIDGANGNLVLGGTGTDGDVTLKATSGADTVKLDAAAGACTLGGGGVSGRLGIRTSGGKETLSFDANNALLIVGGESANGDIHLKNSNDIETIKINGAIGDIEFLNADVAEEFTVAAAAVDVSAGTVMVLDGDGALVPCAAAYDPRVVGIVAGAGRYRPGIILDKTGEAQRRPIALLGKTVCLVDAGVDPVEIGDLLTTSPRPGHAMKAGDRDRAQGCVIGKALQGLASGIGAIPVLVLSR